MRVRRVAFFRLGARVAWDVEMLPARIGPVLAPLVLAVACGRAPAAPTASQGPAPSLVGVDGSRLSWAELTKRAPLTVVVFVSATCPCMAAHRDRADALAEAYGPRGVQVIAVESDVMATPDTLAREASDYRVPLFEDQNAHLADVLGAEYATYAAVVDREGRIRYHGGFDSDRVTRHDDAIAYVRNALEDLLAGRAPKRPEAKTLGCMLRKHR